MIIDLTLDSLMFPGLENYTPPFGTKKGDNVGLTTAEGCANLAKPWQDQRPIVISENSSTNANIERNAVIEIDTASITLTINDAIFTGCKLSILTTFTTGTVTLLHNSASITLQPDFEYTFRFDGTNWINSSPMAKAYPIGSYYLSESDVDPVLLFGFGTWARVAGNATIWGTSAAEQAGQTKAAGLPNITGTIISEGSAYGSVGTPLVAANAGAFYAQGNTGAGVARYMPSGNGDIINGVIGFSASRSNSIFGNSSTVQPPARTVNIWKRTA